MPLTHLPPPPSIAVEARQVSPSDCSDEFDVTFDRVDETKARLSLRNIGREACRVFVYPNVSFRGRSGEALNIARYNPFHPGNLDLGHGPVMASITVAAGGTASADLSWTDKPSGRDHCLEASEVRVNFGTSKDHEREVSLTMCGGRDRLPIFFQQSVLKGER